MAKILDKYFSCEKSQLEKNVETDTKNLIFRVLIIFLIDGYSFR